MKSKGAIIALVSALGLTTGFVGGGCPRTVIANLVKERQGSISVIFVNNTPYTAAFSYGTWNPWDNTPGAVTLKQLRLEPNTSSDPVNVRCDRTISVGTEGFIARATETKADEGLDDFDPDAFTEVVNFSIASEAASTAGLPTEGYALGVNKLLGVHFSCGDQLIFIFEQDPDATGGFRIDFEDILDKLPNE